MKTNNNRAIVRQLILELEEDIRVTSHERKVLRSTLIADLENGELDLVNSDYLAYVYETLLDIRDSIYVHSDHRLF